MEFVKNDGGREAAGFKGNTGDCVVRAIAIALELPYLDVYNTLYEASKAAGSRRPSPRNGVRPSVYRKFFDDNGWVWVPTMTVGSGCKVHLRKDELPSGRIVVRCSKHIVAVVDGVLHDTYDSSRDGGRCVYGYWRKG